MSSLEFDLNALQTIPLFNNIINSLHDGVLIADPNGICQIRQQRIPASHRGHGHGMSWIRGSKKSVRAPGCRRF